MMHLAGTQRGIHLSPAWSLMAFSEISGLSLLVWRICPASSIAADRCKWIEIDLRHFLPYFYNKFLKSVNWIPAGLKESANMSSCQVTHVGENKSIKFWPVDPSGLPLWLLGCSSSALDLLLDVLIISVKYFSASQGLMEVTPVAEF